MPQSLAQILVQLVFSTKNRHPWLDDSVRSDLHAYLGGVVANMSGAPLAIGSVCDHVHLLMAHPRTTSPADLVLKLKTASTKWLKACDSRYADFHWQTGYGMFSISPSHRPAVTAYIAKQDEHHRKVTFQEEFRNLLCKYGIECNEAHIWD